MVILNCAYLGKKGGGRGKCVCGGEDEVLNIDAVRSHEDDQRADLVLEVSLKCFQVALLCKRKNV